MKLVTTEFRPGGPHEKLVVAVECRICYKYTPPQNDDNHDGSGERTFKHIHKIHH